MARFSYDHEITTEFQPRHERSITISYALNRLHMFDRAYRMNCCGTLLGFSMRPSDYGTVMPDKLKVANFCRDRLCPMCNWRRSLKIYGQTRQVMEVVSGDYDFLMLNLTIRNVTGEELPGALDDMLHGWKLLMKRRKVTAVVAGAYRALEITRNQTTGEYHPHFHAVLAVPRSYWHHGYISQKKWLSLWRECFGDPQITQVFVTRIRGNVEAAVAEVAKYAVKDADYLSSDAAVADLAVALHGRRLVSYSGVFADVRRQLRLDDPEDGDLVVTNRPEDQDSPDALAGWILFFGWRATGYAITKTVGPDSDVVPYHDIRSD